MTIRKLHLVLSGALIGALPALAATSACGADISPVVSICVSGHVKHITSRRTEQVMSFAVIV